MASDGLRAPFGKPHPWPRMRGEAQRPVTDPSDVEAMPLEAVPGLLAWIASEQMRLSAVEAAIAARLLRERRDVPESRDPQPEAYLTVRDVAQLLRKSTTWVRRAVRRGELVCARQIGRSLRFSPSGVRGYLEHAIPCAEHAERRIESEPFTSREGTGNHRDRDSRGENGPTSTTGWRRISRGKGKP